MTQALIEVRTDTQAVLSEMRKGFAEAWNTGVASNPVTKISFSTADQLLAVFTPKRRELLALLQKKGPSSIRGLTRALERDVRRVHDDVSVLIEWGMVERDDDGKVFVPYDVIHVEFDIKAAA
jgi:predicted transcriptional regulator